MKIYHTAQNFHPVKLACGHGTQFWNGHDKSQLLRRQWLLASCKQYTGAFKGQVSGAHTTQRKITQGAVMLSKARLYDIIPLSDSYAVWKSPGLAFLMWQSIYHIPAQRNCPHAQQVTLAQGMHSHYRVPTLCSSLDSISPTEGEHLSFNSTRYHSELLGWLHEGQTGQSPEPERSSHFRVTSEHPGPQETSSLWRKGRAWTISFLLSAKLLQASTATLFSSSMSTWHKAGLALSSPLFQYMHLCLTRIGKQHHHISNQSILPSPQIDLLFLLCPLHPRIMSLSSSEAKAGSLCSSPQHLVQRVIAPHWSCLPNLSLMQIFPFLEPHSRIAFLP